MSLDIGYHIMSKEVADEKGVYDDELSIVEFLRKVENLEDLPYDVTVYGLDSYLEVGVLAKKVLDGIQAS
jgi:hypothetical protein